MFKEANAIKKINLGEIDHKFISNVNAPKNPPKNHPKECSQMQKFVSDNSTMPQRRLLCGREVSVKGAIEGLGYS